MRGGDRRLRAGDNDGGIRRRDEPSKPRSSIVLSGKSLCLGSCWSFHAHTKKIVFSLSACPKKPKEHMNLVEPPEGVPPLPPSFQIVNLEEALEEAPDVARQLSTNFGRLLGRSGRFVQSQILQSLWCRRRRRPGLVSDWSGLERHNIQDGTGTETTGREGGGKRKEKEKGVRAQ